MNRHGPEDGAQPTASFSWATATRVREVEQGGIAWTVLRDREGDEFCLLPTDPSHTVA